MKRKLIILFFLILLASSFMTFTSCKKNNESTSTESITYTLKYTASDGGYIVGKTVQTVKKGGSATKVTAVPEPNYSFIGWSDGITSNERLDINIQSDLNVYAKFIVCSYITTNMCSNNALLEFGEVCNICNKQCILREDKNILMKDLTDDFYSVELYEENVRNCFESYMNNTKEIIFSNKVKSLNNFFNGINNTKTYILKFEENSTLSSIYNSFNDSKLKSLFLLDSIRTIIDSFNDTELIKIDLGVSLDTIANSFNNSEITSISFGSYTSVYNSFMNTPWRDTQGKIMYVGKVCLGAKNNLPSNSDVSIKDQTTILCKEAFLNQQGIKSITFSDSVQIIEDNCFKGCSNLQQIILPDNLSHLGNNVFYECNNLIYNEYDNALYLGSNDNPYLVLIKAKNLNISSCTINENTRFIYEYAFSGCKSLMNITVPDKVTTIGDSAFYNCSNLTRINIGKIVTKIGNSAFYNCNLLTDITMPQTDVTMPDRATTIGLWAFYGCNSLKNIYYTGTVDSWIKINGLANLMQYGSGLKQLYFNEKLLTQADFTFATNIPEYAFNGCSSLTSITIPNIVTSIGSSAFEGCKITYVKTPSSFISYIPKNNLQTVEITTGTTIPDYAFYNCSLLTSIVIPDSINSVGNSAFNGCSKITSITIPSNVTSIGNNAFKDCNSLTYIYYTGNVNSWVNINELENLMLYGTEKKLYINNKLLTRVEITTATKIPDYAFYGCNSLTTVTIGKFVASIGRSAFNGCSSLTSITIPDSVTSIGSSAFEGCKITYVKTPSSFISYIPKTNLLTVEITTGTTIPTSAFSGCNKLTNITIPNTITSIGNSAFYNCSSLTSITIPDSITSIGDSAFVGCKITYLKTPSNFISYIPKTNLLTVEITSGTSIYNSAFNGCNQLTTVKLGKSVTSIEESAFSDCIQLTSVSIYDSIRTIGKKAFYRCNSLKNVFCIGTVNAWVKINGLENLMRYGTEKKLYINDKLLTQVEITTAIKISDYAFYDCTSLTTVTIGNSVTSIGQYAFLNCSSLKTVYYKGTQEQWKKIYIQDGNTCLTNANVIYNYT